MVTRWKWYDPELDETWEVPMNPNQMSSPHVPEELNLMVRNIPSPGLTGGGMSRAFLGKTPAHELTISGVSRSHKFYRDFAHWRLKRHKVHLTDDLGRTWLVHIRTMEFQEQRNTARNKWRFRYTIRCILHGEL